MWQETHHVNNEPGGDPSLSCAKGYLLIIIRVRHCRRRGGARRSPILDLAVVVDLK